MQIISEQVDVTVNSPANHQLVEEIECFQDPRGLPCTLFVVIPMGPAHSLSRWSPALRLGLDLNRLAPGFLLSTWCVGGVRHCKYSTSFVL